MERKDMDPDAIKTYLGWILWEEIKNREKMLVPILLKYLMLNFFGKSKIKEQFLKQTIFF